MAFRATLRIVLGRAHPDYQALRNRSKASEDEALDASESQAPSPTVAQGGLADEAVEVADEDQDDDTPEVAAAS